MKSDIQDLITVASTHKYTDTHKHTHKYKGTSELPYDLYTLLITAGVPHTAALVDGARHKQGSLKVETYARHFTRVTYQ